MSAVFARLIRVPPPVSLHLRIHDIRWCLPVCFILDLMVFGAQGRLDSTRLRIAGGCLAHTLHECVPQESILTGVLRRIRTRLVCGTDDQLVDLGW
ncbi:hypothetical protein ARMSODRAFT_371211 [Armillaria solidipes]|uniref:Uncharacterized protein n=1 Tax=Armillaria solidipes TaxID=1076256 RepID=A0A2H3B5I4_9AGAR|nr:hypothetical protein ARMSODRAFT_371211 [Armillaria solidipes]